MSELVLFAIVGLVALATAVAMLLSDNPVHSALFLIVTMGCIAFMFLLLNAPFLALIQIAVYAGAIMVLFLFVIMLLGSERVRDSEASTDSRRFRWFTPLAWGSAAALLLLVGIGLLAQVNLGLPTSPTAQPQVRVLNAAPDAGTVNIYANDQLIASALPFRGTTEYTSLAPGDYTIKVQPENGGEQTSTVTLQGGTQQTLVSYGDNSALAVSLVPDDNTTVVPERSARVTFFNGYVGLDGVQVVDLGSQFLDDDTAVIVDNIPSGTNSTPIVLPEGTYNWAVVQTGNNDNVLIHLDSSNLKRNTSTLFVVSQERAFDGTADGTLRAVSVVLSGGAAPAYGGPEAIGIELFTNYMLVFQLVALVLLAAMVGAIVLTHKEVHAVPRRGVGERRRVSRPLVNVIASQVGHDVTSPGESVPELQEPAAGK